MKNGDSPKNFFAEVDLSKCRILVIDNSEDTRNFFEMEGKNWGYQVALCQSGQEGLAKICDTGNHYDVVFLDLVLPDFDGLEILREIKRERPDFNVVIITEYYHEKVDSAVTAIKEGADDYIKKPFGIDEIVSHINKSVQLRRLKGKLTESTVKITQLIRTTSNLQEILDYAVQALADIPIIVGASIHQKIDERLELKATSGYADDIEKQVHDFQESIRQYTHDSTPKFEEVDFRDARLDWTCIPLFHEKWGILGIVNIYHQLEPHINIREWRIAQAFLRQVTFALTLFGELQIANQIIAEMERGEDLKEALGILLQRCIELFNGKRGSIFIFDDHKIVQVDGDEKAEVSLVSYWNHHWNLKEEGTIEKLAAECLVTKRKIDKFIKNDLSDDPSEKNIYATFFEKKVRSVITTGIFIDNNLLGAITIADDEKDAFTEDQLQFLRTICNQISPHIISARQRTVDRKTSELNRFLNDLDVRGEEFLNRFTREVVDVLECEGCNLYLLDEEDNRYELKASKSTLLNGEMPDIPPGFRLHETPGRSGLLCWVAAERDSLRLNHPRQFEEFLKKNLMMHVPPDDKKFPYWQFLGIPVVVEDKCIAVIEVAQYSRPKTFTIDDEKLLKTVAFSLGRAIKSQKLYQEVKRRAAALEALNRINEALNRMDDRQKILEFILQTAIEQVKAKDGAIFVKADPVEKYDLVRKGAVNPKFFNKDIYVLQANTEDLTEIVGVANYGLGEGLTGKVVQEAKPINIRSLSEEKKKQEVLFKYDPPGKNNTHFLGVPLKVGDEVSGIIKMLDKQTPDGELDPRGFTQEDQALLVDFANQAAIALRRAELNRQNQDNLDKTATLYNLTNVFQGESDLDRILFLTLTGLTIKGGLEFNRALLMMVYPKEGSLVGKMAVGPRDEAEAQNIWTALESYIFDDIVISTPDIACATSHYMVKNCKFSLDKDKDKLPVCVYFTLKPLNINREKAGFSGIPPLEILSAFYEIIQTEAFALAPLVVKDNVLGIIYVDNKFNGKPITDIDVQQLSIVANQAAIAMENYDLVKKSRIDAAKTFHSIKNKVSAIRSEVKTWEIAREKGMNAEGSIENIRRSSKDLNEMTSKLVALSSPRALNRVEIDFRRFINEIVCEFAGSAKIEIIQEISDPLPLALLDQALLKEAVIEILINTVQVLEKRDAGKIWIRVRHENRQNEKWLSRFPKGTVRIQIEDNGPGIPERHKERIWDLGFTLTPGGNGLGLFGVSKMAEDHMGKCYEDGIPGQGARFNIVLPLV